MKYRIGKIYNVKKHTKKSRKENVRKLNKRMKESRRIVPMHPSYHYDPKLESVKNIIDSDCDSGCLLDD